MQIKYPYSRPMVTDDDIAEIIEVARSQFLTQGPRIGAFEAALSERLAARHSIVCNSGTAALHMIYAGLEVGPGTAVVVPAITFLATANAARMCGATVIFADVDPKTGLVTPETLDRALRTAEMPVKVAAAVHLAGLVCDMPGLSEVAEKYGCVLIEDACHAPGASYTANGKRHLVGSCGHSAAAAFSFHAVKHVAMGEGGAVLTNNPVVHRHSMALRSHGMLRDPADQLYRPEADAVWYYEMHEIGWNYRADDLACSLGLSQLRRLDEGLTKRREQVDLYDRLLADIPFLTRPEIPADRHNHAWHLYQVAIDFLAAGKSRGQVVRELMQHGIGTQVHYIPLHLQPYYRTNPPAELPGAMRFYERTLSIPLYPQLMPDDLQQITGSLRQVLGTH